MRVLLFGTSYADTPEKRSMIFRWLKLNEQLNPDCKLMMVDSASPHLPSLSCQVLQLGDNIGHLSRGGRDGWGRAFCAGLQYAIDQKFDYVAHVETDSLFRLPIMPIVTQMNHEGVSVASVPVRGTKKREQDWVETGLMIFGTSWVRDAKFIEHYDWPDGRGKMYPRCPEWHVWRITRAHLRMMPWSAERGDCGQITRENVRNYDWITHVSVPVADAFVATT